MSYMVGFLPRMSPLPSFVDMAPHIALQDQQVFLPSDPARIDGQIDAFACCCQSTGYACSPDQLSACPQCLLGLPCRG